MIVDEAWPGARVEAAEHRAADAGVFVAAGGAVGTGAGAELELAGVEVLLELAPFGVGGLAVFGFRAGGATVVEEGW